MRKILTAAVIFWAGGVTNVLLWCHSLTGDVPLDVAYNTALWPWYATQYLWFLATGY